MIVDALRYPIADGLGRTALRNGVVTVVAIAVGVRYAAALLPSVIALVPAIVAFLGLVGLFGTAALVLTGDENRSPPSARVVIRTGVGALALSVVVLGPSLALLTRSLTTTPEGLSAESGAALFSLVSSTATIFFFVACAYVYPAAIAASASAGRMRPAAETDALRPVLTDPTYFLRWTVGFSLVTLTAWLGVTTIARGDVLGVVAAAAAAYLLVAGARVVGVGYDSASLGESTE